MRRNEARVRTEEDTKTRGRKHIKNNLKTIQPIREMKSQCQCQHHYCLYNSICYAFGGLKPTTDFWATPLGMKRWLNIDASEQVPPSRISELEDKIRVCISVDGIYESTKKFPKKINLVFENGHYSFVQNPKIQAHIAKKWKIGKQFVQYYITPDFILTYDGDDLVADYTLQAENLGRSPDKIYKQVDRKSWTPEMKKKLNFLKAENKIEDHDELFGAYMVQSYEAFMRNCDHLKQFDIDLSAHGFSVKDTAVSIFAKFAKAHEFSEIDEQDMAFVSGCKNCGLIYASPKIGHFRNIDGNSFYPSLMRDPKLILPLGNPQFLKIEKFDEVIRFGIYKCVVSGYDKRLFLHNPANYYTYTDVKFAIKHGYKVELVQDLSLNFMFYDSEHRDSGYSLFRGFVDTLYQLKKLNPLAKELLNILWGSLCERKKIYHHETNFNDLSILDCGSWGGEDNCYFAEESQVYKLPYARIGVFLTAFGRAKLGDFMADIKEEIFRIHTDGFWTTSEKQFDFSADLGGFKLESEGDYEIVNMRKPKLIE